MGLGIAAGVHAEELSKEDKLLKMIDDIESELGSLEDEEKEVEEERKQLISEDKEAKGQYIEMDEGFRFLDKSDSDIMKKYAYLSSDINFGIEKLKSNIVELEQVKRDLIEELVLERIKINREIPFLQKEVEISNKIHMKKYENFLKKYPLSDFSDNIMFRLTDYYYKRADDRFSLEYEKYDQDMTRYDMLYEKV